MWQDLYKTNYDLVVSKGFQEFIHPNQLEFNWVQRTQAAASPQKSLENYKESINTLLKTLKERGLLQRTREEIFEDRSDSMHNMANNCYKVRGVWKIGDAHVGYIENKYPDRKYELISECKFNKHFYKEYPDLNPNKKPEEES